MHSATRTTRSRLFLAIAVTMLSAQAQAATTVKIQTDQRSARGLVANAGYASNLGLDRASQLEPVNDAPTAHGTQTIRMQQTWHGVPVFGATVTTELGDHEAVMRQSGEVVMGLAADLRNVTPKLSVAQARALWQKQTMTPVNAGIESRDATLMVYAPDQREARLVYKLSHYVGGEHPSRPSAIMDADTGEILEQWEGLTHAKAQGPGGNKKTGIYHYGSAGLASLDVKQDGAYCLTETANVRTHDLKNGTNLDANQVWRFLCPTSQGDAINDGYGAINDAHHFGGVVFDMYRAYLDRAPLRDRLELMVHYGRGYDNAEWNGRQMLFGDGATLFYPLVGLDVIAHEVSHGFTEQNSGLMYTRESGGMNEAFSDIAGDAAEWFDKGKSDLLVGADIFKAENGALRYMCQPGKDGRSIDHASKYKPGMSVHHSSGVYNKAYCQLVKRDGWNPEKAFKAFARANMLYWKANETFNGGACGVERAAADLNFAAEDVTAAFSDVGVACKS